jgi:two-component system response regulator AlgR
VPSVVVAEAADGRTALEQAQSCNPDVALIDIRMPGMDGVELARHLARLPAAPAVIFVTAFDQYAVQAFELAALDYLVKPVRANRLADALKKARRHADESVRLEKSALAMRQNLSCLERGRILLVPVTEIAYLKAEQKVRHGAHRRARVPAGGVTGASGVRVQRTLSAHPSQLPRCPRRGGRRGTRA